MENNKEKKKEKEFKKFVDHCIWTYECWMMNQLMCEYQIQDPTDVWPRFGVIMREYVFSQIAKINDPAGYKENYNLSLEYITNNCVNTIDYHKFRADNADFIKAVKNVRDKVTSHSDLYTYYSGQLKGNFPSGLDEKYFKSLLEIISLGYKELGLGPFDEWPPFIEDDVKGFMDRFVAAFNNKQ